jgi:hypothetical protein
MKQALPELNKNQQFEYHFIDYIDNKEKIKTYYPHFSSIGDFKYAISEIEEAYDDGRLYSVEIIPKNERFDNELFCYDVTWKPEYDLA